MAWAIFAVLLFLCVPTSGAPSKGRVWDQGKEVQYFHDLHRREYYQRLNAKFHFQEQREDLRGVASNVVENGNAAAPDIFTLDSAVPPPPPKPSIFEGKGHYILLGLAFVLLIVLTTVTLIRHRREAEIRLLSGKYLADGREAAHFHMPALFEPPPPPPRAADVAFTEKDPSFVKEEEAAIVEETPAQKFFAAAPEHLAQIRKVLPQLRRATEDADRHTALLELHELISVLKEKANVWDLRPVWQLTSALDLLLKRLADKSKDVTPSTVRTIATALDLLATLCVPGVRPDLIITPPIQVLAVDDDPLCLRAVVFALEKADMKPDTAKDGELAVALANEKAYDVVFMDIKMPNMNGLMACEKIHELKRNSDTPVVFVTVQSDFRTRTESSLVGGTDIMAKPFLMFEITVKALTLAMRKRLQLAASCEREVSVKLSLAGNEKSGPERPKVEKPAALPAPTDIPTPAEVAA